MAERLIIVSDMWGAKKGLWITSYLGYLQQYYDITFYDSQQLANIDLKINTEENVHAAFVEGGIETAAAHLLMRETEPAHYLAFSTGGTIVWQAALKELPVKSIFNISSTRISMAEKAPETSISLVYGGNDKNRPTQKWADAMGLELEVLPNFGHTLYSDEKIIRKVCLALLSNVSKAEKKVV